MMKNLFSNIKLTKFSIKLIIREWEQTATNVNVFLNMKTHVINETQKKLQQRVMLSLN